jgi:hypothetical protein
MRRIQNGGRVGWNKLGSGGRKRERRGGNNPRRGNLNTRLFHGFAGRRRNGL